MTSTRKADLEDIIDYYALQLDNPISVLTQDMARQFLSNSTPELKYKLFVQGVQLEQLHQDYDLLTESIDTIERTFDDKRSQLSALESKMNSAQRLLNIVKQQDNLRAKMTELRNEMAWCQVQDQENYLREQDAGVQETEKAVTVAQREVDQLSSAYDDAVRDDEGADESLSALRSESSPIEDERKQQEEIYKNAKTETHTAQVSPSQTGF